MYNLKYETYRNFFMQLSKLLNIIVCFYEYHCMFPFIYFMQNYIIVYNETII